MNYVVESFNTYSGRTTIRYVGSLSECRIFLIKKADEYEDIYITEQELNFFTYETEDVAIYYSIRQQGRGEDLTDYIGGM